MLFFILINRDSFAGYSEVVEQLQEIPSSAVFGPDNESAMHVAVRCDHPGSLLISPIYACCFSHSVVVSLMYVF